MERQVLTLKRYKIILLCLLLFGCTSFPKPRETWEWWGLLPESPLLLYGKMKPIRADLLQLMQQENDLKEVVQRSTDFYAAITPASADQPLKYAFLLLGDFPKGLIGLSLGWNQNWRYSSGNPEQWIHTKQSLAVLLPEDGVVVAQNLPWEPRTVKTQVSNFLRDFFDRTQQKDLVLVFEKPFRFILENIGDRLPVGFISFLANYQNQGFFGTVELHFQEERQSRLLAPILRLTQRLWLEEIQNLGLQVNPQELTISVSGNVILVGPLIIPLSMVESLLKAQGD